MLLAHSVGGRGGRDVAIDSVDSVSAIQNTCVHLCIRAFVGACVVRFVCSGNHRCAILLTHVFLRKSAYTSVHFDQAFSSDENQGYVNFLNGLALSYVSILKRNRAITVITRNTRHIRKVHW